MTFDKFTIKAQEAIQEAVNLVQARGQQAIEPEHLLAGILKVGENVTNFLFQKLGVNSRQIEQVLESQIASLPKVQGGEPYLSRESNEVLTRAQDYASKGGDEFVSLEPMLLALLNVKSTASRILKDAGITEKELASAVNELRKGEKVTSQNSEDTYQALNKYAKNLIEEARSGKLDPVIGRDEEIRRVLQILSRRTKNNPILTGYGQDGHRGRTGPSYPAGRRAGEPERQTALLPRHGCADCRCQIQRGIRGTSEIRHQRSDEK